MFLGLARLVNQNSGSGSRLKALARLCDRKFEFSALYKPWPGSEIKNPCSGYRLVYENPDFGLGYRPEPSSGNEISSFGFG